MNYMPWIFTTTILTALITASFAIKSNILQARNSDNIEQSATVQAIRVKQIPFQSYMNVSGVIKAPQTLSLVNESAGKITKLSLKSGGIAQAGNTLIEIEHNEEKAQLQAAKSRLAQHTITLGRYKNLFNSNKISAQQLDESMTLLAEYKAQVDLLSAKIAKKIITAPFTANIGIHDLQVGQFLPANTNLVQLVGVQNYMWIDFSLPQTYPILAINTPITLSLLNGSHSQLTAQITSMEPAVSKHSRQLKYRAKVPLENTALSSNQLVKVKVPVGGLEQVHAIPYLAVIKDQLGNYVYLLDENAAGEIRAKRTPVELGERIGDLVMISKGLKSDTLIANQGAFKLRDGLKTLIQEPQSANAVAMENLENKDLSL